MTGDVSLFDLLDSTVKKIIGTIFACIVYLFKFIKICFPNVCCTKVFSSLMKFSELIRADFKYF